MCGLILAPDRFKHRVPDALKAMNYRGPDKHRVKERSGFALGHARLPIQDLTEAAAQPYESQDRLIGFVGEIFTRPTGFSELQTIDLVLKTRLDSFHTIDGFWSIVELKDSGPLAITDYLGTKPLFYWEEHKIVCSEIFPMFELCEPPSFDEVYLSNCIKFGYDYSGRTPFEGIKQIPAGSVLDVNSGSVTKYWNWSRVPGRPEDLFQILKWSVSNRMISDVPVGLLLSGGLDSSIVYYLIKLLDYQVEVFSVENGESEFLPDGHSTITAQPVETKEAVRIMQAPLDLGSLVPQIQLAKALGERKLNVVLTGDGADELFGGYTRSMTYDSQASDVFCELPYYHLPRLDRVMMHSTIEQRSPFLSPFVIASALRTPRPSRTGKKILKDIFRGAIPDRILDRQKHPLKTQAVIQGGLEYREHLVQEFRKHV